MKEAETLDFAGFWRAYEALIVKVRSGQISPDDFAGTTCTITNPGMIGTVHSVPRLMPGQGFIVGVGSIGYPAEFEGADPAALAQLAVSKVTTLTNTYDHRIITGAESGEFLRRIHELLLGADDFYDDLFASLAVPYEPARWNPDRSGFADPATQHEKIVQVHSLVNMYRVRGHLIANLDPLGRREPNTHPELDIAHHDLSIWDLDRDFPIGNLGVGRLPRKVMPLRDILGVLRDAYARTVGVEYMHIQEPDQKEWIQQRVEGPHPPVTSAEKHRILERLNAAEAFERFLHTKYLGQKRFSLEGAETLVPMLDELCTRACDAGMSNVVFGMAHRGRLNVLANVIGKSYSQIFREFEGELDPASTQGSGDVKYHLGAVGKHESPDGNEVLLTLAANPSHLEAVGPVVEGMARAIGDAVADGTRRAVLPVLLHGDAAFAGQGVVAETFNLSEVPGYEVGGTIHVVVNNQLGFTTPPDLGRSSVYPTDVAKMVQAPIFHVNGDDPEAAVRVMRLAFEFRNQFQKDVVVDLVCYRRYGHNEADEPAFTQPRMYELIDAHPSVRSLYTQQLVQRGDISLDDEQAVEFDFKARLDRAFEETHASRAADPEDDDDAGLSGATDDAERADDSTVATGVPADVLHRVLDGLTRWPDGFEVNPKLERQLLARRTMFERDEIDWALAEALSFGSLVLGDTPVRLAGQDTRRGTFSQRHGVLVDQRTEAEYVPLAHLADDQAPFMLFDTVLSEYAALGLRVRLLHRIRCAGVLGGAVRRLRQRRAGRHRPVRRGRRRQVGPAQPHRPAAPSRARRAGPGALERAHRALPHALGGEQPPRRLPHHCGAVLPRAAPAGRRRAARAARVLHAEAVPAHAAVAITARRVHQRPLRARARRPRRARHRQPRDPVHRQDRGTSSWTSATPGARRLRSCASSSSTRGPTPSCSRSSTATPTPRRCGGCRRSRRTWARGPTCTTGCTGCCATGRSSSTSRGHRARARPAEARRCTTPSSVASRGGVRQALIRASPIHCPVGSVLRN